MAIFLTGSTGYIGGHVAANLLQEHGASLNLLVRARDPHEAETRLWQALQLHLDFSRFYEYLQTRIRIFRGDLTETQFGLGRDDYDRLSDRFRTLETEMRAVAVVSKSQIAKLREIDDAKAAPDSVELAQWRRARERARAECALVLLG